MIKHLKLFKIIQFGVLLGASLMLLGPEIARTLTINFPEHSDLWKHLGKFRVILGTASLVVLFFSLKWVWRPFWKIKGLDKVLSKSIAPDLNGEWNVKLESNYPILEKLKKSAKGKRVFDVASADIKLPDLSVHEFDASINQSWEDVKIEFRPNGNSPLQKSETLTCSFFKSKRPDRQGLTYVYRQESNTSSNTDDEIFYGAAELIIADDARSMSGHYWTKRQWQKGLNTAGRITFTRK